MNWLASWRVTLFCYGWASVAASSVVRPCHAEGPAGASLPSHTPTGGTRSGCSADGDGAAPLHQSRFTLAASIFLGGHNSAAKEYNISLAVTTNNQNNIFSWLFLLATKKNVCFLGCLAEAPRKLCFSLAVLVGRQEIECFLGYCAEPPRNGEEHMYISYFSF